MTPLLAYLVVTVVILVLYFLPHILEYYRIYKIASAIPGPGIGFVLKYFSHGNRSLAAPVASDIIWSVIRTYRPTLKFWSGPILLVLISDPRDLEYFLTNKELLDKSPLYRLTEPHVGKGLLNINGDIWKKHRKTIAMFFHTDILREYRKDFRKGAVALADRLEAATNGESTDVVLEPYLRLTSVEITCKTVLATDTVTHESDLRRLAEAVPLAIKLLLFRLMRPWYINTTVFRMCSKYYKHHVEVETRVDEFLNRVVKQKREDKTQILQGGRRAFIDLIVNSEELRKFNDEELQQEIKTLVTVATASVSDTIGFVFQVLALKQDVQDEVVRELTSKLEETGGKWADSIADQLPYLDRVIKETLRFFPIVPIIVRGVHKDTKLPSGVVVPRGAHLAACFIATHRDEENFSDPLKFDPDRFLPERKPDVHPFAYVPFSAGPRNCIGQKYAMLAITTVVATVLLRFRLYPAEGTSKEPAPKDVSDIRFDFGITLSSPDGYKVNLTPRYGKTIVTVTPERS